MEHDKRIARFCEEWRIMMTKGGNRDGEIYSLNTGSDRAAQLLLEDLEAQALELQQLRAIVDFIDERAPRADASCRKPGITLSEAARNALVELADPRFKVTP